MERVMTKADEIAHFFDREVFPEGHVNAFAGSVRLLLILLVVGKVILLAFDIGVLSDVVPRIAETNLGVRTLIDGAEMARAMCQAADHTPVLARVKRLERAELSQELELVGLSLAWIVVLRVPEIIVHVLKRFNGSWVLKTRQWLGELTGGMLIWIITQMAGNVRNGLMAKIMVKAAVDEPLLNGRILVWIRAVWR
jgi:hypothetical protein